MDQITMPSTSMQTQEGEGAREEEGGQGSRVDQPGAAAEA